MIEVTIGFLGPKSLDSHSSDHIADNVGTPVALLRKNRHRD